MNSFKRNIYKTGVKEDNLVPCDANIEASGNVGVYEVEVNLGTDLGYTGIQYNAYNIPDRFQIIYDGQVVADSKFVGNENYFDQLDGEFNVNKFVYEEGEFIDTGDVQTLNISISDAADGSTSESTSSIGVIYFNRDNRNSDRMLIRATGVLDSTVWDIKSICPQENKPSVAYDASFVFHENLSNIDCNTYKTSPKTKYYFNENVLGEGVILYNDEQLINKAKKGYYVYSSSIYYFNGNEITDVMNCNINEL